MIKNKTENISDNVAWKFIEVLFNDIVSFIISVVLARLLSPADYGEVAMVTVFIALGSVFVINGLGSSLIQKKNPTSIDFSSVLYVNILMSLTLYFLLYIFAPTISKFYNNPHLSIVLRVLGIVVPLSAISSIQNAYVAKKMLFKELCLINSVSSVVSGVIGVVLAYTGYGVWALVLQTLLSSVVNIVVTALLIDWRPKAEFSISRVKGLFSYGWKILASSLIKTGYNQTTSLIIGKYYTSEDLAYYSKGSKYSYMIINGISSSISAVMFPVFSNKQEDIPEVKRVLRKSIGMSSFLVMPALCGLAAVAKPFVLFLLTDKWIMCVPFLQICCIRDLFEPVTTANLQVIRAMGRSDLVLKLDIIKRGIGLAVILFTIKYGVIWIALAPISVSILAMVLNIFPNRKLIGYTYKEQFSDIGNNLLSSLSMFILVLFVSQRLETILSNFMTLFLSCMIGACYYIVVAIVTKNKNLFYVIEIIKEKTRRISKKML